MLVDVALCGARFGVLVAGVEPAYMISLYRLAPTLPVERTPAKKR
ncbi:hypothetical protein BvCmsKKP059_05009 [Escherichia coli]|jgi:hypothetical protein|nr:hypothetical protein G983_03123 [Escherichia coli UMEA 3656-1]CAD5845280.1 Uncharacterised protein [Escherichia coli]GDG78720.1 hypothetical protein BvCmsKKP059_05009 [Escherichia coli]GDL84227.1 hypothetical protein BvCmsKSNP073_04388 [Escherichia coli]GDT86340.1 hypothetical protein BvCmsOUNP049_03227 [Escherichia coli]